MSAAALLLSAWAVVASVAAVGYRFAHGRACRGREGWQRTSINLTSELRQAKDKLSQAEAVNRRVREAVGSKY